MDAGYSIDQMLELRRLLSKYVGEDKASEWVQNRFKRGVRYGLPANKGRYTPYGVLENIDVRPERYMPPKDAKVTLVPDSEWRSSHVSGTFSPYNGIKMPETAPYGAPEATLSHEGQHYLDTFVGDEYHPRDRIKGRLDGLLKDEGVLLNEVKPKMDKYLGDAQGITGQRESYEVVPQLRSYEAQMPAWKRLQATEFFKNLSNDAKALIMRKFFPTPNGYDAITGLSYD